ncbi:transposase [Dethiobacter alkaliphilus]|uniref:Transposase IS200-like domain-containing protein n=1 Tax=Dethiobacter alkaliphilus AHT 1 TaxID=555088 RepID=C0GGP0_DETAL|nr:transposase [Dethiobacter alkaliphilus]EEG77481.1 protein of unknown function DUF1568 [Dethiobacter alkaliphilus AHT 1]
MPRRPRLWYPGAAYHIMCRGNHRQEIFRDDEDRQVYLRYLLEAKNLYRCILLTYCLMTNHVHLQIETTDIAIWEIMKRLNMRYAIYFNLKYNFVGHLFQGRYRAEIIERDAYNLDISKYIHLNPVSARMVEMPLQYPWSSYQNYLGIKEDELVSPEKILGYFRGNASLEYQKYVEQQLKVV